MSEEMEFLNEFIRRLESDIKRIDCEVSNLIIRQARQGWLEEEVSYLRAVQALCRHSIWKAHAKICELA
jgi:hypothetical protein